MIKKKKNYGIQYLKPKETSFTFHCLACHEEGEIPYDVVPDFDLMDGEDPTTPPQFHCERSGGEMYPAFYKGVLGLEYKLSDVL